MASDDPFDLQRFVLAQRSSYETALAELRAGHKRTHWIWFVLPQLRGLGASSMAQAYGLSGLEEARAYLAHPLLGPRLLECVRALLAHAGTPAQAILGEVDARKLRSCLTLFVHADPHSDALSAGLAAFFNDQPDPATLALLAPVRPGG